MGANVNIAREKWADAKVRIISVIFASKKF